MSVYRWQYIVSSALVLFSGICTASEQVTVEGQWIWLDIEGGFCAIVTDNKQRYLPVNSPVDCRSISNKSVTATIKIMKGIDTVQMWGTPVELISVTD